MTTQITVSSVDEVLKQIEKGSEENFLPVIERFKGRFLADELRKAAPQHLVDAGALIDIECAGAFLPCISAVTQMYG
jgi:hypothetical protein